MPRRDPHHRSDPETTFDTWLDAFLTGTPGGEAAQDDPSGPLNRAQAGARQLHGLAARAAMPATAAEQRIREELMQRGALAAPCGTTWIPEHRQERRAPWWSAASAVLATVLAFALVITLVGTLLWTQRPALSPSPSDAPGFAVASPVVARHDTLACGAPGYRPIISGEADDAALAMLGGEPIMHNGATTITAANGEEITFDEGTVWAPYPGPDSDVIISGESQDTLDTVTNLATGDSWSFRELDAASNDQPASFIAIGPWLLGPTDETATDWYVINTTTGEERLTSEIFGAPFSQSRRPLMPEPRISVGDTIAVIFRFVDSSSPDITADDPTLVIPTDLRSAHALDPQHVLAGINGVISPDGKRIVYLHTGDTDADPFAYRQTGDMDRRVRVLDGTTGELVVEHPAPETNGRLQVLGLTAGDSELVLRDSQHVWTVDIESGEIASVLDPDQIIYDFELDPTAGTALASTGTTREESYVWVDPATGEVQELDLGGVVRFPRPQFGWALIQSSDDVGTDYALLDMATGEFATDPTTINQYDSSRRAWIIGDSPDNTGIYVVLGEPKKLLVHDGPGGRAFTLPEPTVPRVSQWSASAGISPNGECIVYTFRTELDEPGMSWIAPLEPNAQWTQLPFELHSWLEVPIDSARTLPAQDFTPPVVTPQATPLATPATSERCDVTLPNGDVPPGKEDSVEWYGSEAGDPSLWLIMTWDDGLYSTEPPSPLQTVEGYPLKLAFFRGEGSGDITLTAVNASGDSLSEADRYQYSEQPYPIPGIIVHGIVLPSEGCWTITATDGNDTLTWTMLVEAREEADTTEATPQEFTPNLRTTALTVNMKEDPATNAEIVTALPPGTPLMSVGAVEIDEQGQRWVNVATEDGDVGWIRETDLEPLADLNLVTPAATQELANVEECDITEPNGATAARQGPIEDGYGNEALWTLLWPDRQVIFEPGGPGFVLPDGALGMKWGWVPLVPGELSIDGQHLDGAASPLRADIGKGFHPDGYGPEGRFFPAYLIFPTPGCWEVTGHIDGASLTFDRGGAGRRGAGLAPGIDPVSVCPTRHGRGSEVDRALDSRACVVSEMDTSLVALGT